MFFKRQLIYVIENVQNYFNSIKNDGALLITKFFKRLLMELCKKIKNL